MKPTNLLRSTLGATVLCKNCTVDGFAVDNLISDEILVRQKGTLLEHFIRPPVDIDFRLPCASDIAFIRLKLSRASSIVHRLQVWAQCLGQNHWTRVNTAVDVGNELHLKCGLVQPPYLQLNDAQFSTAPEIVKQLRSVTQIRITIQSMKDNVAVCLAGCEAIGVPSRHVPRSHPIFSKFPPKHRSMTNSHSFGSSTDANKADEAVRHSESNDSRNTNSTLSVDPQSGGSSSSNSDFIPEEFLDAITFTLMTIPVALPSGNIVDQSTLDKHVANENRWGRAASDPFTGVPLRSRPSVLVELKSRIDHFLSKTGTSSETRLADGRNIARAGISRLIGNSINVTSMVNAGQIGPSLTLSTDLRTAFKQALAAARQVLKRPAEGNQQDDSKRLRSTCSNCDSQERSYKLVCGHILCRPCALLENTAKCGICGTESVKANIVKINLM